MFGEMFSSTAQLRKSPTEHPGWWECTVKNTSLFNRRKLDPEGAAPGSRLPQGEELNKLQW